MTKSQDIDRVTVNEKGIPVFIGRSDSVPICATAEKLVAFEHDILEETDLIRAGYPVSATPSSGADELIMAGTVTSALKKMRRTRSL